MKWCDGKKDCASGVDEAHCDCTSKPDECTLEFAWRLKKNREEFVKAIKKNKEALDQLKNIRVDNPPRQMEWWKIVVTQLGVLQL